MAERLVAAIGDYKWLLLCNVLITVIFTAFIIIRAEKFTWNKKTIRLYAILYDLDTRGLIGFSLALTRLIFIFYLAVTGGSAGIQDAAALFLLTLVYAVVSQKPSEFLQIFTYLVIYVILLMEGMFLDYYRNVEESFLIIFLVVTFGMFVALYGILQFITGYERLINESADRFSNRQKKEKKKNEIKKKTGQKAAASTTE